MLQTNVTSMLVPADVRIAVLIPCYNEEITIGQVIDDFRIYLPACDVHVYDNASTDQTATVAQHHGAIVHRELRRGKGNVVRRMFADVDADIFILVDGDNTYEAGRAPEMIRTLITQQLDMVNGARQSNIEEAYRPGHRFGNWLLSTMVELIFGRNLKDMLSGFKILSRRFVKSFPAMSTGFEIETEIAVHALELRMPCAEVLTEYKDRPAGSQSKLRTFHDGWRILMLILRLVREERPFQFFGFIGLGLCFSALIAGLPLLVTYVETGLVPRIPTAILCVGLTILGVLSFFAGLILDMITRTRRELKRLVYLATPSKSVHV